LADLTEAELALFGLYVKGGTQTEGVEEKRDEVTGGWRKLLNEGLHNLYFSPNEIRVIKENEVGRTCSTNGEKRIPLGRPRHTWENNIKIDLRESVWDRFGSG
jgi:hypothetical protein